MCGYCCGGVPVEKRGEGHKSCSPDCYNVIPRTHLLDRAQSAEAAVVRVRELHSRYQAHGADGCDYCREPWPCTTIAALDGLAPTPTGCACVCHTTPGIAHVLPCCNMSGILIERNL